MIFVTVGTHEQSFNRLLKKIDELKKDGIIQEDVIMQTGFSTYEPKYCECSKLMVDNALSYLKSIKGYLQTDHYYLLTLLKFRLYFSICMLLHIKNTLGQIGRGKGK